MATYSLNPADMSAASGAASDVAASARGADSADAYAALARGLPGSTTADVVPELADAMEDGLETWSTAAEDFSAGIDQTSADGTATDGGSGFLFDLFRQGVEED